MNKKKIEKFLKITGSVLGVSFLALNIIGGKKKKDSVYANEPKEKNPLEGYKVTFVKDDNDPENADGVRGHLEAAGKSDYRPGIYEKYIKRAMDVVLSFGGLVVLSPLYIGISAAIIIDDPGPVFFTQKRLGQNKKYFKLHKFRSMKMSTPHDVPTHMLENPEQYITRVGKFLRAHSLDELPQIWDIFIGNMSVIGPRPGLWNQDVLTAERDKYNANDIKPGLTGWAQINGRDELEITVKAKLDGEYVRKMGPVMDAKCFLGSVGVFAHDDSVVEGGTGEMKKAEYLNTEKINNQELIGNIGFGGPVEVDFTSKKKVLITGANSYIGESFQAFAEENYEKNFEIDTLDMLDPEWRKKDFSVYDIVYHVAGIAHADVGKVSEKVKQKYYDVNTNLTIEVAEKAKKEGVKEFVFMSSMIVYGDSAPYGKKKIIDKNTVPCPANFYGDSKLQADIGVRKLADTDFKVIVLRPPMIYGKGSKGNYPILANLAKKLPVFPEVENERSMLYIENLCEFLCQTMLIKKIANDSIVLIPQNGEWTKTSDMVHEIANISGKNIKSLKMLAPMVWLGSKIAGKIGELVNKAFGNNVYNQDVSEYEGIDYRMVDLKESIKRTEENNQKKKPKVLIVASVASMIDQFNMQNIELLLENGYDVDVACNFKEGSNCSEKRIAELLNILTEKNVNAFQIDFSRNVFNIIKDIVAIKQTNDVMNNNANSINKARMVESHKYCIVHSHSPIGGIVGRLVAKQNGVKNIYTAHGFHFYKGGTLKNWALFYPIEKLFSVITDVLITINEEDYELARKKFKAKKIYKIPGIGLDMSKFQIQRFDREAYRRKLGLSDKNFMILSVGELNENKNHKLVIQAISKMKDESVHYYIAGVGKNKDEYEELIRKLKIDNQVHLLGYRTDIAELNYCADVFAFPSIREGLGMAALEALACGTPICGMDTRGIKEYVVNGQTGYVFENNVEDCINSLEQIIKMDRRQIELMKDNCKKMAQRYSVEKTNEIMRDIYRKVV